MCLVVEKPKLRQRTCSCRHMLVPGPGGHPRTRQSLVTLRQHVAATIWEPQTEPERSPRSRSAANPRSCLPKSQQTPSITGGKTAKGLGHRRHGPVKRIHAVETAGVFAKRNQMRPCPRIRMNPGPRHQRHRSCCSNRTGAPPVPSSRTHRAPADQPNWPSLQHVGNAGEAPPRFSVSRKRQRRLRPRQYGSAAAGLRAAAGRSVSSSTGREIPFAFIPASHFADWSMAGLVASEMDAVSSAGNFSRGVQTWTAHDPSR